MAFDVVPDIVDGMEKSFAAQCRATTSSLGDVVILHADGVAGADHLKHPIMVAVASSRVVGLTVDEVAREFDARARCVTENIMLSARAGSLSSIRVKTVIL